MLSRETLVQIGVGVIAVAVFWAVPAVLDVPVDSWTGVVWSVLFNAVIFGGAHLVLAVLGEDNEDYPVIARWRTVALVTGVAVIVLAGHGLDQFTAISGDLLETGTIVAAVLAILIYWCLEARDGYRNSRPS